MPSSEHADQPFADPASDGRSVDDSRHNADAAQAQCDANNGNGKALETISATRVSRRALLGLPVLAVAAAACSKVEAITKRPIVRPTPVTAPTTTTIKPAPTTTTTKPAPTTTTT
ncbi:MAG: hypothetical protein ACOYN3_09765, partial [Acidimicrobiia bacterium]